MKPSTAAHLRRRHPVRAALPACILPVGFAAVLVAVCRIYLFPALRAAASADPQQQRQLAATAWLILAVVLFVLFAGLLLAFRVGRFFFPRPPPAARQDGVRGRLGGVGPRTERGGCSEGEGEGQGSAGGDS